MKKPLRSRNWPTRSTRLAFIPFWCCAISAIELNGDKRTQPVERTARHFNPLAIPRKLQEALPYKNKPKVSIAVLLVYIIVHADNVCFVCRWRPSGTAPRLRPSARLSWSQRSAVFSVSCSRLDWSERLTEQSIFFFAANKKYSHGTAAFF